MSKKENVKFAVSSTTEIPDDFPNIDKVTTVNGDFFVSECRVNDPIVSFDCNMGEYV